MNEADVKIQKLKQLGLERQQKCYEGYHSIAEFHNGKYESDFVAPYSKGACNIASPIVILLQDWLSHDKIAEPFNFNLAELGRLPSLATNKNLEILLGETFELKLLNVFATNIFPFIKKGKNNTSIPNRDMFKAYKDFCYPQIEIIKPRLVICCGKASYDSSLDYFKIPINKKEPVGSHFKRDGILFYKQSHPGGLGVANAGGINTVKSDWKRMKNYYEQFLKDQ